MENNKIYEDVRMYVGIGDRGNAAEQDRPYSSLQYNLSHTLYIFGGLDQYHKVDDK